MRAHGSFFAQALMAATAPSDALLDATIDALYLSVSDPQQWDTALARLSRAFDCPRVSVMQTTPRVDALLDIKAFNHDLAAQKLYSDYYWALDPTYRATREAGVGQWLDADPLLAPRTTPAPEYADFAARNGLRYVAGGKVHADAESCFLLGLQRPADHRPFDGDAAQVFARLAPHIGRASSLATEFQRKQLAQALSMEALDTLEWPVYAVGRDARVLLSNRIGERQLALGSPFGIRHGRLHCHDLDVRGSLMRALGLAMQRRASAFRAGTEAAPWWVRVVPMAAQPDGAMLYASAVGARPPSASVLQAVLGFSAAEAEVANLLMNGRNVKQVAQARSVSLWTVRAQVRAVMQKAGVRRQMQLAQLLLALPRVSEETEPGR